MWLEREHRSILLHDENFFSIAIPIALSTDTKMITLASMEAPTTALVFWEKQVSIRSNGRSENGIYSKSSVLA